MELTHNRQGFVMPNTAAAGVRSLAPDLRAKEEEEKNILYPENGHWVGAGGRDIFLQWWTGPVGFLLSQSAF